LTSTGYANVVVSVSEEETIGTGRLLSEEAATAQIFVNPLKTCPYDKACTTTLVINVTTGRPDGSAGTAEISWELDLGVAYPNLQAAPADAQISLAPHRDG
jgi:hypothetical protein